MKLISIESAAAVPDQPGAYELRLTADLLDGLGPQNYPYGWRLGDPHGLGPQVDAYLREHPELFANAAPSTMSVN